MDSKRDDFQLNTSQTFEIVDSIFNQNNNKELIKYIFFIISISKPCENSNDF